MSEADSAGSTRRTGVGRPWHLLLLFCLLSSASVVAAGFLYSPPDVDGGWASYGGFAVSQHRDPYLHQGDSSDLEGVPGVKSLFFWDTVSNTRSLYTAIWLRLVGPSWQTVKILSIMEYLLVLVAAGAFFRLLLPTAQLAILATALLATDKMVVMLAATTFRPDLVQAAVACLFYLVLRQSRATLPATLALALVGAVFGAMSASAVTPVGVAAVFRGVELMTRKGAETRYRVVQLSVAVGAAATAYLFRRSIFPLILRAGRPAEDPVDSVARIGETWAGGISTIVGKESDRLGAYFGTSNLPLLAVLCLCMVIWLWPRTAPKRLGWPGAAIWAAIAATGVLLVVFDPHPRPQHLVPAMPFVLLLLSRLEDLAQPLRRTCIGVVVGLTLVSGVMGFALAGRLVTQARSVGFSNSWLSTTLKALVPKDGKLVVAGATEFWPYFDTETDVTIVDLTRNPDNLDLLEPFLPMVDVAILSTDYEPREWMVALRDVYGIELTTVIDRAPYVVIATGFPKGDVTEPLR